MMDEVPTQPTHRSVALHCLVNWALGELCGAAAEQAEFGVGPISAVTERLAEGGVGTRNEGGVEGGLAGEERLDFAGEFGAEFFVGVERENPVGGGAGDGGVFLRAEAFP